MRLIFRRDQPTAGDDLSDTGLSGIYRHPLGPSGRWLRTNFVTSLDGSIQGANGRSGGVNTASDHKVFALHRAHCDAVLVGAGTARVEGYRAVDLAPWQRSIRAEAGLAPYPLLAVVTRSLDLDPTVLAGAAADTHGPVMIVTTEQPSDEQIGPFLHAGIEVLRSGADEVDLPAAVEELVARGFGRLLCEGGPRLHRDLLAADLVDSVSLTLSPVMIGGNGSRTTTGDLLATAPTFELDFALYADDHALFTSYVRRR